MKKIIMFSFGLIGFLAIQLSLVGCDSPKQRAEVVDQEVQPNLIVLKDAHDMTSTTSKAYFYKTTENKEIKDIDKSTVQLKNDEIIEKMLAKVTDKTHLEELTNQLTTGLISYVIYGDKVTIYKVLTAEQASADKNADKKQSINDLRALKKDILEKNNMTTETLGNEVADNNVKFIEITSIQITTGILGNKKTKYYDEKMSTLTVDERPFNLSTHILLGDEVTVKNDDPAASVN